MPKTSQRKAQVRRRPTRPRRSSGSAKRIQKWLRRLFLLTLLAGLLILVGRSWRLRKEQEAFVAASREDFIELVGETAQGLAADHDLYASVMVAQAILESDWGQSQLTREANNLFGIKGDYWGRSYEIETAEDDGTGQLYMVLAKFRHYPSYHASLEDNAKLLSGGLVGDHYFYSGTWKSQTNSYQDATAYLQGRYATDTSYANKLNALIEQYDLTRFDTP